MPEDLHDASLRQFSCGENNPYCSVIDSGRADSVVLYPGRDERIYLV